MTRFSLAALTLGAALVPAAASAAPAQTVFEHAGERYVYTTKETNGRTLIRGYTENGYAPFELVVRNGRVSGTVDGRAVSFRVSEAKAAAAAQVAAR